MKVVGIIAEYNPFHNGHIHHINEAIKTTKPDIIIAIITGYFTMRGEVSVINKYDKTKIALDNQINLVIELPYLLGTQNADVFAQNAVDILAKLRVDTIVAGSESFDLKAIKQISELEKQATFQKKVKEYIQTGYSYRKSFSQALEDFHMPALKSNDLLNLKYYDAINKHRYPIELKLIQRLHSNYTDTQINDTKIQSATAIRNTSEIADFVPKAINDIKQTKGFLSIENFAPILKHIIITQRLSEYYEAKEGIENTLTYDFQTIKELIDNSISKRYQSGRIQRFISYLLTNCLKKDYHSINNYPIRILGFDETGQKYLNQIKKEVTIISTIKEGIHKIYDFELKIAKIFTNVYHQDFIKMEQSFPFVKSK